MPAPLHAIFYADRSRRRLPRLWNTKLIQPLMSFLLLTYRTMQRGSIVILTK